MLKQITGGVLTGGLARRFQSLGAIDKGLLNLAGRPLVAWAVDKLQDYVVPPVLISANRNIAAFKAYGQVVIDPDYLPNYQGPLAGILAMLERTATEWLMVLPVDSPFVPSKLIADLWQAQRAQPEKKIFFAQHERSYPLCVLLHRSCTEPLRDYLLADQRRVQRWLAEQQAVAVDVRHYKAADFFNINEPADLYSAQQQAL